jgi:hypothetical protein
VTLPGRDQSWTLERVAPLSGVGFAALALLGYALWSDLTFLDPPQDIAAEYVDDPGKVLAGSQTIAVDGGHCLRRGPDFTPYMELMFGAEALDPRP